MRLLVITQAVDSDDLALGFFVRWLQELAEHTEQVEVICLKKGEYELPPNVRVYSLGKERGVSRIAYILNFYRYISSLSYDTVFVHMNEEYVLMGGLFWWLGWTKVVLWRNHKTGSWLTRLAAALSTTVCYTSPEAFIAQYKNAVRMPIGIDTDFFAPLSPAATPAPKDSVLFLGRLDPVKKAERFIEALAGVSTPLHADMYGSSTEADSAYVRQITDLAQPLIQKGVLTMRGGIPYKQTRDLYRRHAIYVNLTPSGSFDKTIGEAAAAGCVVVCANRAMGQAVSPALMVQGDDTKDIARGISAALGLSPDERVAETRRLRAYIEEHHSLRALIEKLEREL